MKPTTMLLSAAICVAAFAVPPNKKITRPDFGPTYTEETKAKSISFVVLKDGTLQAILPVGIPVDKEKGEDLEPHMTIVCDAIQRRHVLPSNQTVSEIVLKCNDGRVLVVLGMQFTPSQSKGTE